MKTIVFMLVAAVPCLGDQITVSLIQKDIVLGGKPYSKLGIKVDDLQMTFLPATNSSRKQVYDVTYENKLDVPALIHQHGLVPHTSALDGVPFLQAPPLMPGERRKVSFPITKNHTGSMFGHSHYGMQHIDGLSFPLIVLDFPPSDYPLALPLTNAQDVVVFLEDFCPYFRGDGPESNANCTTAETASVYEKLKDVWDGEAADFNYSKCSDPGEVADVSFRYYLANEHALDHPDIIDVLPGRYYRLRFIGATSMTNFKLDLGVLKGEAIATDGQYIHPYASSVFWLAVAQRLDVLVKIPDSATGFFPIFAVSEGSLEGEMGQTGVVLVVKGSQPPKAGFFPVVAEKAPGFMEVEQELLLSAWTPLAPRAKGQYLRVFNISLTGDNGFNSINQQSWQMPPMIKDFKPNPAPLKVEVGDRVCFRITNHNADNHAMHLHGHSFQVVSIDGKQINGAVRDTVLVPRGQCRTVEICFDADAPGEGGAAWPFHCHMSYHLAAGMVTTVEYQ